jgi:hypothetical protein
MSTTDWPEERDREGESLHEGALEPALDDDLFDKDEEEPAFSDET